MGSCNPCAGSSTSIGNFITNFLCNCDEFKSFISKIFLKSKENIHFVECKVKCKNCNESNNITIELKDNGISKQNGHYENSKIQTHRSKNLNLKTIVDLRKIIQEYDRNQNTSKYNGNTSRFANDLYNSMDN